MVLRHYSVIVMEKRSEVCIKVVWKIGPTPLLIGLFNSLIAVSWEETVPESGGTWCQAFLSSAQHERDEEGMNTMKITLLMLAAFPRQQEI